MDRIPILRMGDFLLVTIQVDMHDQLALTLQDDLTSQIAQTGAKGVLIDISALDMVDSFIGRMIANISAMSRILDAQTVVVGMRPAVAITLVELGLDLPGVDTALDVERGMERLRSRLGRGRLRWPPRRLTRVSIRTEQDVVAGAPGRTPARAGSWASASSIRPRWSPRRASWPATSSSTGRAVSCGGRWSSTASARGCGWPSSTRGRGFPTSRWRSPTGGRRGRVSGLGLSGAKRLVHDFEIETAPGQGTRVTITRWK